MKLNFIWDRCTWASSAIWKDAFRVYSQPQVTYFASEWYVAKIPLECWLGKSQPAKSQQGRELHDQCILFSYHFLAIIMLPTHSHKPSTLYIVPYNRKLFAFVIDKGKLPLLIKSLSWILSTKDVALLGPRGAMPHLAQWEKVKYKIYKA